MARLVNIGMKEFLKFDNKKIIAFGAGRKFTQFVSEYNFENKIAFVVDNDSNKWETKIKVNNCEIEVCSIEHLIKVVDKDTIVLITNLYSIKQIFEQLNQYNELKDINVYSVSLMQENCPPEKIIYTQGKQMIPKLIHYCWFGHNEIPEKLQKIMSTWKKMCPDYEIVRWDESNYDITKNRYMNQAYDAQKWGFVPDYARLDIIYNYGGIYLDTDVEIVKSFDDLLNDQSFWGYSSYSSILTAIFGAVPYNEQVLRLRNYYDEISFINNDGTLNMKPCTDHQNPLFKKFGYSMNNSQQNIDGNMVYPMEVLFAAGFTNIFLNKTENTHSIHWTTGSWESSKNLTDFIETRTTISNFIS